jgi:hypothetical protein
MRLGADFCSNAVDGCGGADPDRVWNKIP